MPFRNAASIHRGLRPRPVQVSVELSGFEYFTLAGIRRRFSTEETSSASEKPSACACSSSIEMACRFLRSWNSSMALVTRLCRSFSSFIESSSILTPSTMAPCCRSQALVHTNKCSWQTKRRDKQILRFRHHLWMFCHVDHSPSGIGNRCQSTSLLLWSWLHLP